MVYVVGTSTININTTTSTVCSAVVFYEQEKKKNDDREQEQWPRQKSRDVHVQKNKIARRPTRPIDTVVQAYCCIAPSKYSQSSKTLPYICMSVPLF